MVGTDARHVHRASLRQNRRLALREFAAGASVLRCLPDYVSLPTGLRCSLTCSFCIDRRDRPELYPALDLRSFRVFAVAAASASDVQLYGWGEPLANPDFESIWLWLAGKFPAARLHLSTNGVHLDERWRRRLLDHGDCAANVSLNAATRGTFRGLTGSDLFERVVGNLRQLVESRESRQVEGLDISVSFVAVRSNVAELPPFVRLCAGLGVRHLRISSMRTIVPGRESLGFEGHEIEARASFERAMREARELDLSVQVADYDKTGCFSADVACSSERGAAAVRRVESSRSAPDSAACCEPWRSFLVLQSGEVYPCCRYPESMGNLLADCFESVWNGERFRRLRRRVNSARPPRACAECRRLAGQQEQAGR